MNDPLNTYNEILFVNLRPLKNTEVSDLKFRQDLKELKKSYYQVQPNYEVTFAKPLSNKRKYYHSIIEYTAIDYLNSIHTNVAESINDNAKKYQVQWALTRTIPQKLKEVQQVIQQRNYTDSQVQDNSPTGDEAFILFYLKHQLVRLYLEIQEHYPDLLKEEPLTEEEIYLTYFNHAAPSPSYIADAEKISISGLATKPKTQPQDTTFRAIQDDVREAAKGILPYATMIKNANRFSSFEDQLFQKGYIDANYKFINSYGQKNEMAAIYHQLIKKGYFSPRNFENQKDIKPVDIRKFLDHRYGTDVDKQFRTYANDEKKLMTYIESQYWLTSLLTC